MTQKERTLLITLSEWALGQSVDRNSLAQSLCDVQEEVAARESTFTKAIRAGGIDPLGDVT